MIRTLVEELEKKNRLALDLLQRLALFMAPVTERTEQACHRAALAGRESEANDPELLRLLIDNHLVFRVSPGQA